MIKNHKSFQKQIPGILFLKNGKELYKMKKEYETPKVELLEFDYSQNITTSGGGRCFILGASVTWANVGAACTNSVAGDE